MECMPRWSLPHHPPPNSLIQLHPKPFMEIKWGPYAIWLSPLMDPPKMDQGKFGGLRNVPGPTLVCGAAASLLRFAVGKETLPGLIIRWERLESRGPPTCSMLSQEDSKMCAASGRQPSWLCQAHVALASWDPKVSTHWSPRSAEASSLSRMLRALPCCTGSQKGLVCLELSFSPSMFWWPSCVAAEVAFSRYSGMEPRARGAHVRRHIQGHQRQQDSYYAGSGFSSHALAHR